MGLNDEQKVRLYTNMVRVRRLDKMLHEGMIVTRKVRSIFIAQDGQEAVGVIWY